MAAQFTIDSSGKVVASTATGLDQAVASCVAGVIQTIEFPAYEGDGTIQVTYPFTFQPEVVHE